LRLTARTASRKLAWLAIVVLIVVALARSASFLVVDEPKKADAILVLAGETEVRPARAVELLAQGYSQQIVMNVPDWFVVYGRPASAIAEDWARAQKLPVSVCVTHGRSTKTEAEDTAKCLDQLGARSVLLVTSDFHTRRARSTLRQELAGREISVAAAYDPSEFGTRWWEHREWAKTNFYEWMRLAWWEGVDRWLH
jgi:uncharacterized SAM-binding protein YcdF (DUF218 family)